MWKVKFCKHLEKLQTKKTLKFQLELNFTIFKKGEMERY